MCHCSLFPSSSPTLGALSPGLGRFRPRLGFSSPGLGALAHAGYGPAHVWAAFPHTWARPSLAWVHSLPPGSKAFLYLHVLHPHNPYDPPEPYRSRYTAEIPSVIDSSIQRLLAVKEKRIAARPPIRAKLRGSSR